MRDAHRRIIKNIVGLPKRVLYLLGVVALVSGSLIWWHPQAKATTDTFTTSTTWTVPAGVSSAVFEAWGGGGAGGGTGTSSTGGSGGAGGQYAKTTLTGLTSGNIYTVTVATTVAGGTGNGTNGNDSSVTSPSSSTVVLAKGGAGGQAGCAILNCNFGSGAGSTTGGVGDLVYAGGSGALGSISSASSGAGAGGAGSSGNGGDASGTTGGTGTASNGGNGANGGTGNFTGTAGSNYGGGGSGGSKSTGGSKSGGGGAQGLVTITYTVNSAPSAPTLSTPSSGATGVSVTPSFTLKTTDADNDYLQYRIYLYQSDCSTVVGSSPFAEASSQTGWSGQDANGGLAYTGSSTITSSTTATYAYQSTLAYSTTYCWKADAIDPAGTNTYGSASATQLFTTVANSAPNSPTLTAPSSGATGVSATPTFSFSDTDPEADDIQFTINLFQSNCTTSVTTYAMASGQTGWSPTFNGSAGSGLSYTNSTSSSGVSFTPSSALSNSTTYCWSVTAKDPGGSNTTTTSSTQSFTTSSADQANIGGGVNITGGTNIY